MESNVCDINHLDADVLLPPRKRLLAGLKKQNFDGKSQAVSTSGSANEIDARLNTLLRSHFNNPNVSPEEMVEASRSAALQAVKLAVIARAAAEEKAVAAARAVAAAKSALDLVATISEETVSNDRYSKKNKLKKHVPVQMLYNKHKVIENCKTDEELARRLHRAINSSPRISKNSSTAGLRSRKHKRLKISLPFEKATIYNANVVSEGNQPFVKNGNCIADELDSDGSNREEYMNKIDESTSKLKKACCLKMPNGEGGTVNSKESINEELEGDCSIGKKRGRMKQKKLPLSICNFRDQVTSKEELKSNSSMPLAEENIGTSSVGVKPVFSVGPSGDGVLPVERSSMWKCQAFKAPQCVKQSKVMQS